MFFLIKKIFKMCFFYTPLYVFSLFINKINFKLIQAEHFFIPHLTHTMETVRLNNIFYKYKIVRTSWLLRAPALPISPSPCPILRIRSLWWWPAANNSSIQYFYTSLLHDLRTGARATQNNKSFFFQRIRTRTSNRKYIYNWVYCIVDSSKWKYFFG